MAVTDKVKLFNALEQGGTPDRAIVVTSSAIIEPRALSFRCPHCNGEYRLLEHTRPVSGSRMCGLLRTVWFRLVDVADLN